MFLLRAPKPIQVKVEMQPHPSGAKQPDTLSLVVSNQLTIGQLLQDIRTAGGFRSEIPFILTRHGHDEVLADDVRLSCWPEEPLVLCLLPLYALIQMDQAAIPLARCLLQAQAQPSYAIPWSPTLSVAELKKELARVAGFNDALALSLFCQGVPLEDQSCLPNALASAASRAQALVCVLSIGTRGLLKEYYCKKYEVARKPILATLAFKSIILHNPDGLDEVHAILKSKNDTLQQSIADSAPLEPEHLDALASTLAQFAELLELRRACTMEILRHCDASEESPEFAGLAVTELHRLREAANEPELIAEIESLLKAYLTICETTSSPTKLCKCLVLKDQVTKLIESLAPSTVIALSLYRECLDSPEEEEFILNEIQVELKNMKMRNPNPKSTSKIATRIASGNEAIELWSAMEAKRTRIQELLAAIAELERKETLETAIKADESQLQELKDERLRQCNICLDCIDEPYEVFNEKELNDEIARLEKRAEPRKKAFQTRLDAGLNALKKHQLCLEKGALLQKKRDELAVILREELREKELSKIDEKIAELSVEALKEYNLCMESDDSEIEEASLVEYLEELRERNKRRFTKKAIGQILNGQNAQNLMKEIEALKQKKLALNAPNTGDNTNDVACSVSSEVIGQPVIETAPEISIAQSSSLIPFELPQGTVQEVKNRGGEFIVSMGLLRQRTDVLRSVLQFAESKDDVFFPLGYAQAGSVWIWFWARYEKDEEFEYFFGGVGRDSLSQVGYISVVDVISL